MKKVIILMAALMVFATASGCQVNKTLPASDIKQGKKLTVCASFYPMYDFVKKIGGDYVTALNMVPAGTEPHDYEPSVSDIVNLEKADVFIYNGAGLEHWADKVLSALNNKKLMTVEASKGINLLSNTEDNDGHSAMDSHVWLNPQNAKTEMKNIKDALARADPGHADAYETNYTYYADKLDVLDKQMKQELEACKGKEIVVSHEAFGYLCQAYGLTQRGITGLEAESEPNPAKMAEIIEYVKQKNVRVIFTEELVSPKIAETIAKETGARTEVLNPLEGLSEAEAAAGADYFSVMQDNLNKLKKALE